MYAVLRICEHLWTALAGSRRSSVLNPEMAAEAMAASQAPRPGSPGQHSWSLHRKWQCSPRASAVDRMRGLASHGETVRLGTAILCHSTAMPKSGTASPCRSQ